METVPSNRATPLGYPWKIFWFLLAACILGVGAIMPYQFALLSKIISIKPLPVSFPVLIAAAFVQGAVLFGGAVFLGLLLARKVGLETPILERCLYSAKIQLPRGALFVPLLAGAGLAGVVVFLLQTVFLPRMPESPLAVDAVMPIWKRFLASFYGGINEEVLMRLFFLALVIWLLKKFSRTKSLRPSPILFWSANLIVALGFGVAHLPVIKVMMEITPMVLVAVLSANGILALLFGYFCWERGLEAAMLAHFSADIVLHAVGPMVLRT
jgi:hypothetical protein